VPRTQYTKPPGPFQKPDQIPRARFQFTEQQRRALSDLLPDPLHNLPVPDGYTEKAANAAHRPAFKLQTLADIVVYETEGAIASHLTTLLLLKNRGAQFSNPANVRRAIQQLREALKPFVQGWVDDETADLIPDGLDDALAAREQQLKSEKVPSAETRILSFTCETIGDLFKAIEDASDTKMSRRDVRKFVATALDCAGIKYPDPDSHPERLDKLIFEVRARLRQD
jgi:hypothetical protein